MQRGKTILQKYLNLVSTLTFMMNSEEKRPVKLIIAWDGVGIPFKWVQFDAIPQFDFVLFNFSDNNAIPATTENPYQYSELLNIRTEFKGSILKETYHYFKDQHEIDFIGFIDDDIQISVASINQLIETAYEHSLDAFQAAVHPDSFYSHSYNVLDVAKTIQYVHWVEIMMPFYRKQLFDAADIFYEDCISSYGIDNYAMPYFQKVLGLNKVSVIHSVSMKHLRAVTDGSKVFSNGLTARQEGEKIRDEVLSMIKANYADLFSKRYLKEVYGVGTFRWEAWKYKLKEFFK